jgi:hypothetical protein
MRAHPYNSNITQTAALIRVGSCVNCYVFKYLLFVIIKPLLYYKYNPPLKAVANPEIFFGGSTNSVDRGQREQGSGGGSPLVRGSAQFANG